MIAPAAISRFQAGHTSDMALDVIPNMKLATA